MNERLRVGLGVVLFVALLFAFILCGVYVFNRDDSNQDASAKSKDGAQEVVVKATVAGELFDACAEQMGLDANQRAQIEEIINVAYDEGRSDAVDYMLDNLARYVEDESGD